jgi:hypothetical protein
MEGWERGRVRKVERLGSRVGRMYGNLGGWW